MITNIAERPRLSRLLGAAAIAACALGAATPAVARGWHGGWHGPRIGIGFGFYPWGYAYAPPVYYAPPRVYYPPAYYYPAYYPAPAAAVAPPVYRSTTVHRRVVHHTAHKSSSTANCPTPQ